MNLRLAPLALAGMLSLFLSACGSAPSKQAESMPAEPAKPALSAEAQRALAQAEADVKAAKASYTLWVPADTALKNAQDAAKRGDSATVIEEAEKVAKYTRLGAAQADYPSTEMR